MVLDLLFGTHPLQKKIKKIFNVNKLNENSIKFLNWFSEYNIVPKGMALKLHLLSSEAIEDLKEKEYLKFNEKLESNKYELTKIYSKL